MGESVLRDRSKGFAKKIILLCQQMKRNGVEPPLVSQLLRCGTSVGANIHEAQYAQGRKDFISKFEIALKECNECDYWLDAFRDTSLLSQETYEPLKRDVIELKRMLVSSVRKLKEPVT